MKKNKKWIKFKRYPHIGDPISSDNVGAMVGYVKNPENIAKHAFFPLIHRKMVSYPAKGKGKDRKRKRKVRDICYARHLDALIYSYYNKQLSDAYEIKLGETNLKDVVLAYRSIPIDHNSDSYKSHIHFAKEAFDFIRKKIDEVGSVSVVVSDISGFFDNLDHKLLKERWKEILGVNELESDVYNVYRNVTHFSYIDEWRLIQELNHNVVVRNPKTGVKKNKQVKRKRYYRDNNVIAFCERCDISTLRHLITCRPFECKANEPFRRMTKGIPQGLPISATLANVYMLHFDLALKTFAEENRGFYRRYSDDIVLILPGMNYQVGEDTLSAKIEDQRLSINTAKNKIALFIEENGKISCIDRQLKRTKLEYLGFSFDGNKVLLKSKSINHYYLKQKKTVEASVKYASSIDNPTRGILFENRLLLRFTRIGSRMHAPSNPIPPEKKNMLEGQRRENPETFTKQRMRHGNFHTYVARASSIMEAPEIRGQLSRNLHKMRILIKEANSQLDSIPKFVKKDNAVKKIILTDNS